MTTALTTNNQTNDLSFTREQVETIKQTVAKGATDSQLALFLEFCKARRLDPFTRQVYWTPKGIITSIDGFRAKAEETGAYVPGPTRYEYDDKGNLVAAHVTVRKLVAGTWFDLEESAFLDEYKANTPTWAKLQRVMLSKCAEARAIRRAFPMLAGMYEASELDQANEPMPTVVNRPAPVQPAPVKAEVIEVMPVNRRNPDVEAILVAIESAETLPDLNAIAARIKALTLTDAEKDELRYNYTSRKSMLSRGAK